MNASRVVVGIDGSPPSLAALWWATRFASLASYSVDALVAWERPTVYGTALILPEGYDPLADAHAVADRALEAVRSTYPLVSIHPLVVEGRPAQALVDASAGAELLVVGSRGHGEFTGMLLGSVGQHCVVQAHCPVLVFREDTEA
jgi:nucleotide-binding universal stress UspA family protein